MDAKGGLDPEVMVKAIGAGSGRNSAVQNKLPEAVLTRSFDYGAEMHILMKDIDLAIAQGEALGVPMWVCQAARLVFKHAVYQGAASRSAGDSPTRDCVVAFGSSQRRSRLDRYKLA